MVKCPVCLKECIEIKDEMAIHRYMEEWVANMCVISPRTIASQQSFAPDPPSALGCDCESCKRVNFNLASFAKSAGR